MVKEPNTKGILPSKLAVEMKKYSGNKIAGTLQNLSILVIRLGLFDQAEHTLKEMLVASEKEKDDAARADAIAKIERLSFVKGTRSNILTQAQIDFFEKSADRDFDRASAETMFFEGSMRFALHQAIPLFSQTDSFELAKKEVSIKINGQKYDMQTVQSILCIYSSAKSPSVKSPDVKESDIQNYLIEFALPLSGNNPGATQLIAIWTVKHADYLWVQQIVSTKNEQDIVKFEVISGNMFLFNENNKTWGIAEHEDNCSCGNNEDHYKQLHLTLDILKAHQEQRRNIFPIYFSGQKYNILSSLKIS